MDRHFLSAFSLNNPLLYEGRKHASEAGKEANERIDELTCTMNVSCFLSA
jgi:hypothetical protein